MWNWLKYLTRTAFSKKKKKKQVQMLLIIGIANNI